MAISSINGQNPVPVLIPGQGNRNDSADTARVAGVAGDAGATAAIDRQAAVLGTQKSDAGNDDASNPNREPDAKTLQEAVERVKKFVQTAASDVQFSVDDESGIRVVKVVDKETQEVIRQMPSKEVVELAKALDKLQGLMIKQTA